MEVYELNFEPKNKNTKKKKKFSVSVDKENILCKHCKRTASNRIRCLGMCVADNDY